MPKTNQNIWIFNHYAITPDLPSSTRHFDFAKELTKKGHHITIFASAFNNTLYKDVKLNKNQKYCIEIIEKVHFVWIKTFPYNTGNWRRTLNMISFMIRSYAIGRKITKSNLDIKSPDMIIGSSVHLLAALAAYWTAKFYKARFIMEVRDLWPQTLIDTGLLKETSLITKILKKLEKFLYKQAEHIIVLSPLTKTYLTKININPNKISLIPNGVDLSQFNNALESSNKEKIIFTVMYTGVLGRFINLELVLQTAKIIQQQGLTDICFVLVGGGAEKQRLIEKKIKLNLTNLEFWDAVPKKQIPSILAQADACLLIAGKVLYGSENKLTDYMAAGKPIISCLFEDHNNIVAKIKCGVSSPPQNEKKLAQAVIKLYKMTPGQRKQMGQQGRNYVSKFYSIPILTNKLEKIIYAE